MLHSGGKKIVMLSRDCHLSSPSLREWLPDGLPESYERG
jgi:hypothetical protein